MFPYYEHFLSSFVSGESLLRYYSTKKRIVIGEPYVFEPLFYPPFPTIIFNKFLIIHHQLGGINIAINH